jgi:hypothetical protein
MTDQQPSIGDLMVALNNVAESIQQMNVRMIIQEEATLNLQTSLNDIQPRLSILFHGQEDKEDDNDDDDSENKDLARVHPDHPVSKGNEDLDSIPKIPKPRKSMFQRNIDETVNLAERHDVVIQRQTPSHSHIFLSSTDLAEYAQFVNKWFDWEIQHGIKLEPALIVSRNVRNQIMYNNGKSDTDFNSLTPSEFCTLMAKETRVFSKVHFAETLRHAMKEVKVLLWDSVRPSTHERFFQGILRRQKIFTRTFQILMEANKQYCPSLEGKEFGLAQIFLDTIDKNYNKYILAEIPKVKDQNYAKLSDFVDEYVFQAKVHFEAGRAIRLVPYGGNDFKMASPVNKGYSYNPNFKSAPPANRERSGYNTNNNRRLNFVDVSIEDDHSGDEDIGREKNAQQWTDVDSDGEADCTPPLLEEQQPDQIEQTNHSDEGVEDSAFLHAVNDYNSSKDYVKGCVNFALYGNCFNGDSCKNKQGHNESVAKDTREWMIKKLSSPIGKLRAPPMTNQLRSAAQSESNKLNLQPSKGQWPKKIVQRDRSDRDIE